MTRLLQMLRVVQVLRLTHVVHVMHVVEQSGPLVSNAATERYGRRGRLGRAVMFRRGVPAGPR